MIARVPRHIAAFVLIALLATSSLTYLTAKRPFYTDAYYHFNAAQRLANGDGLTDTYLWIYLGAPETIDENGTFPSHIYWMPFASMIAAFGMWLTGSTGAYAAALWPFTLLYFGVALVGFWLGGWIGGTRRTMWLSGLIALFSGLYVRFWGQIDTFTPYAFFGSLTLIMIGLGLLTFRTEQSDENATGRPEHHRLRSWWPAIWLAAGLCSGVGHLTRADGMLLVIVGLVVLWWPWDILQGQSRQFGRRIAASALLVIGYSVIMLPWMMRNVDVIGSALPVGGTQSILFDRYDEIASVTVEASPQELFEDGVGTFVSTRLTALIGNFATWLAVEGMVVMAPLMMVGLWRRRHNHFLRGFWLYALGLHLAMTLVFPLPGYRGGLFHSGAALVPWWAILGVVGLDDTIQWVAKHRRTWRPDSAKKVFSAALVILAGGLSIYSASLAITSTKTPAMFVALDQAIPDDARVVANIPPEVYYYIERGGAVIPNEDPAILPELARRYDLDYLFIEREGDEPLDLPYEFVLDPLNPPSYLDPVEFEYGWLFRIIHE